MSTWDWNGARWWKVDLHAHTPASTDYPEKQRTPREWLLDHMHAGIDAVAVTDHNSGAWIDRLLGALAELKRDQPPDFRDLWLFPGVEISVQGGIHLLAVLGLEKRTSDVDSLLGAVGYRGTKGASDEVTWESFPMVVEAIVDAGGIAIPAHADEEKGLFALRGETLRQALRCEDIFAVEIRDSSASKPGLYHEEGVRWTEVVGSDSHRPEGEPGQRFPGSHFTWVKMGEPDIEGLRLALLDGGLSVVRSDKQKGDPNRHAETVLEAIEVSEARYMGRSAPFLIRLNPWLNAVIGGRGTGKSTLVEFLRLALRRAEELPDELRPDFVKYAKVYPERESDGLLTEGTEIRVVYRKDDTRFRIQWAPGGQLDAIEEAQDGGWRPGEGDVKQRFPVRIYSQKQILQLAKAPLSLLRIVDEAPEVDRRSLDARWREEEGRFLSLRAKIREIEAGFAEKPRLRGELADVKAKLAIFEETEHADVLRSFQRRRRQQRAVDTWEETWSGVGEQLRRVAAELAPESLDESSFDLETEEDLAIHRAASEARAKLTAISDSIRRLADEAESTLAEWRRDKRVARWQEKVSSAESAYADVRTKLADGGVADPAAYGELVQRRQAIEQRLADLADREGTVDDLGRQADRSLERLADHRRELTRKRREFLESVLEGNRFVSIGVVPYGARETVEGEFRRLIQKDDRSFENDIGTPGGGGLLGDLYREDAASSPTEGHDRETNAASPTRYEEALEELKARVLKIAQGPNEATELRDQRFANHLAKLAPEALDRLEVWFPEDSLEVQYSTSADGRNFKSIQEGSPGQKTAALLAFLLSYGDEPLILDQPEDDLDNHLIYDLIVRQLREVKRQRQVLVVSHNANIVVNGDAELVVAFAPSGGETRKECEGSLQEQRVRSIVCDVLEGGHEAFEERYRRIALEGRHV